MNTGEVDAKFNPANASVPAFTLTPPVNKLLFPKTSVPNPSFVKLYAFPPSSKTMFNVNVACGVSTVTTVFPGNVVLTLFP
jgi:hypothetical protein